jgi:apolipoprotein N-acyltransferase
MSPDRRSVLFHLPPNADTPAAFRLAVSTLTGFSLACSYLGASHAIYSWISVGVLMLVVFHARPRVAALCGFLHSFVFVLTSLYWIAEVLRVHGGVGEYGSWGVLALIAAAWGVLTSIFTLMTAWLSRTSIAKTCLAAPFIWVTLEFARNHLPEIGFPWNLLGYPASANPGFLQITTVTGIFGLSFLVAAYNALLAWSLGARGIPFGKRLGWLIGVTAILFAAALVGPQFVPPAAASHVARLVQLNFPEAETYPGNWMEIHAGELDELERISLAPAQPAPTLVVWPEVPAPFTFVDPKFTDRAMRIARSSGHPFLAGVIEWKTENDSSGTSPRLILAPYNSAVMLDANGQRIFSYDKITLVPFGEFEPFPLIHRVVTSVSQEVGGFRSGSDYVVGRLPNGLRFGTFICYEAIFPDEVRKFARNGASLLINISNDGWFGRSAAPRQHLRMARVRAVENRRWLLRATNNGYTVSVDPYGRIAAQLAPDIRGALDAPFEFRTDETFYTRWGDWVAWLCVLACPFFLIAGKTSKRAAQRPQ